MKKILLSLLVIGIVGGITLGVTGAWWSDQATSVNASFNSGNIDLQFWGKNTSGTGSDMWQDAVGQTWDTTNMNPGGAILSATLPMKNVGSIDSDHMDFAIANTPSEAGMDKYMRITKLTYDGESLLEGGAGAVIPDYVAPMSCDINVNMPGIAGSIPKITTAIANAVSGNTICVGPGNYTSAWEGPSPITVDQSVTIVSIDGPGSTILTGDGSAAVVTIDADNVTIKGFSVTNPSSGYGILIQGKDGVQILDNNIHDIGTSLPSGLAQAIYLKGEAGVNGFTVKNNTITNVGNYDSSDSTKGIFIGDSVQTAIVSNVVIENNIISDIKTGRGAYGMLINYGYNAAGYVTGLTITHNTITNLEGLWVHAIGLETKTQSTSVKLNDISNLVDHKFPSDAIAVFLEGNSKGGTVVVNNNNFASDVSWAVAMKASNGAVDATNNWWGDFDPSDQIFVAGSGSIDTSNYANGPFVGLINGIDTIANGFADLRDFQDQGIMNVKPGLEAGERKDLIMDVQLDATTPNQYQGEKVEMTMTVTMQQGPTQ